MYYERELYIFRDESVRLFMLSAMDQRGVTQGGGGWVILDLALEKL